MARLSHPRPVLIGTFETELEGETLRYSVKRSSRARYVRFELRAETGLTVVIPRTYHIENLPRLLEKRSRWILVGLAQCRNTHSPASQNELERRNSIRYLGELVRVVRGHDRNVQDTITLQGDELLINLSGQRGRLGQAVERWYRQQAEKLIKKRADELCPRLGVTYGRLTIRGANTRWGSCSEKGNLNFNWKLMMMPKPVIDYVIIHELAHLKEMNHSTMFWKLVAEHCPKWREYRRWLKEHEFELSINQLAGD